MTCTIGHYERMLLLMGTGAAEHLPIYFKTGKSIKLGTYLTPCEFQFEAGGGSGEGYKFEYVRPGNEFWWGTTLSEDGKVEGTPTKSAAGDRIMRVTDSEGNWTEKKFVVRVERYKINFKLKHQTIVTPNGVFEPEVIPILTEEEQAIHNITEDDYVASVNNGNPVTGSGGYSVKVTVNKTGYQAGYVSPGMLRVYKPKILLHFNENIQDAMGNFTPAIQGGETYAEGHFDKAIDLDGTSCVLIPESGTLKIGTGEATISCWAYLRESRRKQYLFGHGYYISEKYNSCGLAVFCGDDGKLWLKYGSGTYTTDESSEYEMPLNKWTNIQLTKLGKDLRLYVDGVMVKLFKLSSDNLFQPSATYSLKIGGNSDETARSDEPDNRYLWNGCIDEFMMTNGCIHDGDSFEPPNAPYNF